MATAAGNGNEDTDDQSDSLTQESDEIQEMFCEHCKKEVGTKVRADGFCVECMEYLCSTCLRYHKKYVPDHTLQDSANMPQDFCFEKCLIHTAEITKFYCPSCDQTACPICKTENHNDCTVDHIPTMVATIDIGKKVHQMNKSIDENLEQLASSKDNLVLKLTEVDSNRHNASASIKKQKDNLIGTSDFKFKCQLQDMERKYKTDLTDHDKRKADLIAKLDREKQLLRDKYLLQQKKIKEEQRQLDEQFKQAEEKLNNDSEKLKQTDELKLQTQLSSANNIEACLSELKTDFQETTKTGQKSKVFLAVRTYKNKLDELKIDTAAASEDTDINNYEFQPGKDTPSKDNAMSIFGSLIEKCRRRRTIYEEHSIFVESSNDTTKSKITGICKLSDNILVAADNNSSSFKVIDITKGNLSSTLHLEDKPFGVTKVEDNGLAATLPDVGRIQFLSMKQGTKLALGMQLTVLRNCHGIVYKKPNLLVSFATHPGEVQIIDKSGIILKTIGNLTNNPLYIALGTNTSTLYIQTACGTMNPESLTKVSVDGQVITKQTLPNIKAVGLAADKVGTIYVCSASRNSIIQMSADLKTTHEIPMPLRYTAIKPSCMFYCNKEHKLYVGGEGVAGWERIIGVYKVK